jgi:hypothetical protein
VNIIIVHPRDVVFPEDFSPRENNIPRVNNICTNKRNIKKIKPYI